MEFFRDSKGEYSSKRLGGLLLVVTACYLGFLSFYMQTSEYTSLILGFATIGAGLLGSTMIEKRVDKTV